MPGTGIDAVPNLPKCPVPVLCRTEVAELSGTGKQVCTGTGGTGIHIVPNLPNCPVPVLMTYRSYRSVRYRYWCRTEHTELSGTGNTGGMPRYVPYRTHTCEFRSSRQPEAVEKNQAKSMSPSSIGHGGQYDTRYSLFD